MATIKIKDGNNWVGIDALKGDPGESAGITAGSGNVPVNHLTDGNGILFTASNGDLKIDNDIRASVRSSAKATNGRPSGEKATRDALDMQQLTFNRAAYNISTDCLTPGFYPLAKGTTNHPSEAEEYGSVMVVPHYERYTINSSTGEYSNSANNGKLCTQVYFTDGNDGVAGDAIFYRGRNTNDVSSTSNWNAWKRIATTDDLAGKQDSLVSGTNIKTINNQSILGSGNITISGGGAGGRLTTPLIANGGDGDSAGKIILEQSTGGQITNSSTSTLFGFASAGDTDVKVGSAGFGLSLRGSATRPTYNGNELALVSDIPTSSVTGCIPVDANKSGFNLNTVYDASLKLFGSGTNGPKGITYGTVLTMPYRKASGNTKPDFGAQIFIPNGDDDIEHRNSLFFRTSLGDTWNEWQELSEKKPIYISKNTTITDKNIHIDDCIYGYGNGIGWYTNSSGTREHVIFNQYFLKGTKVTYTESSWSSNYIFSLTMGPSAEHNQTTDRRTNDSGWVTSSTATGTLTGEVGTGFAYDSSTKTFIIPYDGYIGINIKKSDNSSISSSDLITIRNWVKNNFVIDGWTLPKVFRDRVDTLSPNDFNHNINCINHRGWFECPENTLIAYRRSRYKGYKMVETDIDFTSDGVPVLLHDSTINRTARNADGSTISSTISINNITFEQARTYDFGIYKGSEFRGEKIPSFQEFMILCKNLGLHPYIELKSTPTDAQIQSILNIVKRTGMKGKVTYISFQLQNLTKIKALDNKARLGYITEASSITQSIVDDAASLKTDYNDVFLDAYYIRVNQNVADMCMNADIELEVWTVDNFGTETQSLPIYVSGFTTNSLNFDKAYLSANGFYYE